MGNNDSDNTSDDRSPKRFFSSLRSKMLLCFGLLFTLSVTAMLAVQIYGLPYSSFKGIYNQEQAQVFHNLNLLTDLIKERLEEWLKERKGNTKALSENRYFISSVISVQSLIQEYNSRDINDDELWSILKTDKAYQTMLEQADLIRSAYPCYETIRIADGRSGTIIFSTRPSELGSSVKGSDDFISAVSSREISITINQSLGQREYHLDITKSINARTTLKKEGHHTIAVLEMSINLEDFIKPLLHTGKELGKTGEALLINQDVKILTSLKHPLPDGSIAKVLEHRITAKPAILAARGEEGIIIANDYRGIPSLAAYRHIRVTSESGWGLVVKNYQAEVFAPIRNNLISLSIIALVSIAIIIIIASFFANTLSRPIRFLGHIARQVETGNFSARAHTSTTGEIGALAKTFNSMVERIQNWHQDLEQEVKTQTTELDKANQKLKLEITERKQAEKEVKEAKDSFEDIFRTSVDGILVCNVVGVISKVNRALEKMLGYSSDELIGKYPVELSPSDLEEYEHGVKYVTRLFEEGAVVGEEFNWLKKDGSMINIELNASLLKDKEGNNLGSLSSIRDITERKEMEHKLLQSEKLKSLGELAGGVAHDFNNCLAAILGRAQLLRIVFDSPEGEQEKRKSIKELKEGLDVIEQASRDGAETVRRIQEFARRRDDDKHFTTVDLNEIIDNALDFTQTRWKDAAESRGVKINIQKELSILPTTVGSASELREVFTNLINNAVDAMPQGGDIKIKTFKEDIYIIVNVEDTGVGVPKHIRDKIFDPFFTTKGVQATGLGMSVSYGIISRHRGTISLDSIEGRGTAFTIKLPISEKVVEEEKVKHFKGEEKKARIMVIEDEEKVRNLLSAILKNGGHEVRVVSDGNQGIEMFEKGEFDLVFTDLGMPGMSGWQVAEKVKSINGRVPVILITGWDIKKEAAENENNYVDLIIHKPFEMEQVLNIVQEGMILRDNFQEF